MRVVAPKGAFLPVVCRDLRRLEDGEEKEEEDRLERRVGFPFVKFPFIHPSRMVKEANLDPTSCFGFVRDARQSGARTKRRLPGVFGHHKFE